MIVACDSFYNGAAPDLDQLKVKSKVFAGQRIIAIQGHSVVGLIRHPTPELAPVR
jgi:hypothetical protein